MLKITNIKKSFGNSQVLSDVNLCCNRGTAVCLLGSNGSGKTTILTIASGLLGANSGKIECDGKIGYIPQENALIPELTVSDNLLLWYSASNKRKSELFSDASYEFAMGLKPFAKKRISKLSGGYKKRVAVACALIGNPDFILMDEPFTALDLKSREDIVGLLCELKKQGKGILFSSHDIKAIASLADSILLLKDGVIAEEAILNEKEKSEQIFLMLSKA